MGLWKGASGCGRQAPFPSGEEWTSSDRLASGAVADCHGCRAMIPLWQCGCHSRGNQVQGAWAVCATSADTVCYVLWLLWIRLYWKSTVALRGTASDAIVASARLQSDFLSGQLLCHSP